MDFVFTCTPVVQWVPVRMLLIICASLDLKTLQVDYLNVFAQAKLDEAIWLKLPQGCTGTHGPNTVLKLQRSLRGLKQAALCWLDNVFDGLLGLGWCRPSGILDPCLFVKQGVICLVCVDDCLFFRLDV
jgi:hypothetical protein